MYDARCSYLFTCFSDLPSAPHQSMKTLNTIQLMFKFLQFNLTIDCISKDAFD